MSAQKNYISPLLAAAAGVILHLGYFYRGQHSAKASMYVAVGVLTFAASIICQSLLFQQSFRASSIDNTRFYGFVLLGLYGSLLTYRLWWHPLNRFPGPYTARISDVWLTLQAKDFDWHKKSLALYRKYGPFVRIGSSTLLIMTPQGVPAMYGTKSGSRRAEWYSTFGAPFGIISPAPSIHRERRRIWSEALSNNALRGYESRIQPYTEKFIDMLKKSATSKHPLDASKWCIYFSWDVMGNLGLDKDFSLLSTDQEHWALTLMAGWTKAIGLRLPPWSINLLKAIPGSSSAAQQFDDYCNDQLKSILAKRKASHESSSLMGIMTSHAQSPPTKEDLLHLQSDCRSVIFAGSDTSASTLIFIFFYLAQHPEHVKKLRQELDPLAGMGGKFKHHSIQRANHLNAVINETLRLQPPGSVIPRQTPSEGIMVQGTFVPGDVTVIGSQYVVGRSEEAYVRPLEFIPERWYAEPDLIKDRAGYAPFNVGPHWCVGRPLATMYLRLVVAECVTRFDFAFPSDDTALHFVDHVQEAHSWRLPPLPLLVSERRSPE